MTPVMSITTATTAKTINVRVARQTNPIVFYACRMFVQDRMCYGCWASILQDIVMDEVYLSDDPEIKSSDLESIAYLRTCEYERQDYDAMAGFVRDPAYTPDDIKKELREKFPELMP